MKFITPTMTMCLKAYQRYISPFLGNHCRFYPSCSQYFIDSIEMHGPLKGTLMGIHRLLRCHPLSAGGVDAAKECQHG